MSDVCLVLEGTYPYVRGGVSSWVHQIISSMSEVKFSILSIMPRAEDAKIERYEVPSNVESIINIYLQEYNFTPKPFKKKTKDLFAFFEMFHKGIDQVSKEELELFLISLERKKENLDLNYAFSSKDFWNAVIKIYEKSCPTISFLDFFWNYRFTYLPLMQLIKADIPPAPLYHTISTGYAGVLASLAKIKFNSSMIATEHGIYTKERRIEIAQAGWIYERESEIFKATAQLGFFKEWWIKYFTVMSKLTYSYADKITTLYNGNKEAEIADGANPKKISIIPNGIDLEAAEPIAKEKRLSKGKKRIAFIGRLVPIKDIKTLIKACKIITETYPDIEILLLGPQEEEAQYFQECMVLIKMLGIEDKIIITGHVDMKDYYPMIDILVLTSISEAQPLVILEGAAYGIPSVATDVGSCRELLEGTDDEDKRFGSSGIITPIHAPEKTAEAVIKILSNENLYMAMSKAARARTKRYYNKKDMINAYLNLYENYI